MALAPLDEFNYHHMIGETAGTVLTVFTSEDCGSCKALVAALQELREAQPQISVFEVDAQKSSALVNEFGFFHLPTLYLYNDGLFYAEIQPFPTVESILAKIEEALTQPPQDAP